MSINPSEQRDHLSRALVNETGSFHYIPVAEDDRVKELLDEQYIDLEAGASSLTHYGRSLLAKVGLYQPKPPILIERPHLEASQQQQNDHIAEEVEYSRGLIRRLLIEGVDDVAIDTYLGLRTDESLVSPFLRGLHQQAEEDAGHGVTFLKWMIDHATNEQLINVWQWHSNYLNELDNDPAFHERISKVKTNYAEGTRQAIAADVLHPDIAIDEGIMRNVRVIHGSPFSPMLAGANALADRISDVIQIRRDAPDFTLYHEITHLLNGGMVFEFDEGTTDLIAAEIYNRMHPPDKRVDLSKSSYADQIAVLDTLNRMGGGGDGLYELSRVYAGPDLFENTLLFSNRINESIGLPVTIPLLKLSKDMQERRAADFTHGIIGHASQFLMRRQVEFLASIMFDESGKKVANTVKELSRLMLTPAVVKKYDQETVWEGMLLLSKIHDQQERGL